MANLYDTKNFSNWNNQNNQSNSGIPWWMNANRSRYPSPMMPPMLDPSGQMGASNYRTPPVYPGADRNIHEGFGTADVSSTFTPPERTGILQSLKDKFSGLTTPMMALLKSQKDNPEEAFGKKYFNINQGRVAGSPVDNLYSNMNVSSGFGKGLDVAGQKRIDRLNKTIAGWEETAAGDDLRAAEIAKERLKTTTLINRRNKFLEDQAAYRNELKTNTGQVIDPANAGATTTGAVAYGGPPTKDFNPTQAALAGGYKGHAATAGRPAAGPQSGSYGVWKRDGGRIGYAGGELVDEDINIQGPGFDVNENMEMAEGPSPFDMRIQELIDEGLSWQEAYTIAAQEFGMAEGQEDSFSEEGIASLV